MIEKKVYLVCFSGTLCGPSVRGPYSTAEARELAGLGVDTFGPAEVAGVVSAAEAAGMLLGGRYKDLTTLSPKDALARAKASRKSPKRIEVFAPGLAANA